MHAMQHAIPPDRSRSPCDDLRFDHGMWQENLSCKSYLAQEIPIPPLSDRRNLISQLCRNITFDWMKHMCKYFFQKIGVQKSTKGKIRFTHLFSMTKFTSNLNVLPSKSEKTSTNHQFLWASILVLSVGVSCCFVAFPRAMKLARICLVSCLGIKVLKQKRGERVKTHKIMILILFEDVFLDGNGAL